MPPARPLLPRSCAALYSRAALTRGATTLKPKKSQEQQLRPALAKKSAKKPIEQYEHKDKTRAHIPPVGLVTPDTDPIAAPGPGGAKPPAKRYQYDPHLDPQLVWAGKAERTSFDVPTVSLHVHERIDPRTIMEAVKAKNG